MSRIPLLIVALGILLNSCTRDDIDFDPDNLLIGAWIFSEYQDNLYIYNRSNEFTDNQCYKFNIDGTLIERKNSGWCGTPPISYADYSGTWNLLNDTLIQVNVAFWGGNTTYKLDIESINSTSLKVVLITPDY
jgi:hypothetical protein